MSLTLILWLILFVGLAAASFVRPVYAIALYMLTFFLCPPFWWWGNPIEGYRWNLYAGIFLLLATVMSLDKSTLQLNFKVKLGLRVALLMVVNATFVHLAIAGGSEISADSYVLMAKFVLLLILIFMVVKTKSDLKIVMIALLLGAAYIGYEVTVNERGYIDANRLEGIGAPGAKSANHFASLMVTVMPLVAPFFLVGKLKEKILAIVAAPFILNVILLCNSRGAFLAAIASGIVFLASAPKDIRGKATKLIIAGSFATFLLMGDARILDRFATTFVAEDERDNSAQSRIDFAKAGLAMVGDYPLGGGGDGFKKVHGVKYLRKLGISDEAHAIHNGYVNEACEWGIQGILLRGGLFALAMLATWEVLKFPKNESLEDDESNDATIDELNDATFDKLTGCALLAGCSAFLVTSLFGDHLDSEWGIWLIAMMFAFVALNQIESDEELSEHEEIDQQMGELS